MRLHHVAATALSLMAVVCASVLAQNPDPARFREMIARLDTNKDGLIEKEEVPERGLPAFERLLAAGDTNKNGKLEADEIQALQKRVEQGGGLGKAGGPMQRLAGMDKNGDGKVSRQEFTGPPGLFDRIDANKDGFITMAEARTFAQGGGPPPAPRDSTGLVPLTELGTGTYQRHTGGLYPGGSNSRPPAHEEAGLKLAHSIRPLDRDGKPADQGKIVLLSIGMSNTTQEFSTFKPMADADPARNPRLVIVDGAQGGMAANVIVDTESQGGRRFWDTVAERLNRAGVTPAQVQAAWVKQADIRPTAKFPEDAKALQKELETIAQILKQRFPNLKLAYYSSRIYAGYATTPLNPEPYAYQSGFAVKWMIERQIEGASDLNYDPAKGEVKAPWLAWGPYLWADGIKPRSDGLTYLKSDLGGDGTHPAPHGAREKVARLLLDFFKTDSTTRPWFLAQRK